MPEKLETFWIEKAEKIKTSGRWAAINRQIKRFASNPQIRNRHFEELENDWMFEVLANKPVINRDR